MRNVKNFTMTLEAYFMVLFLFLCLVLSGCSDDNDLVEREKQKTIQILRVIDKALEEDDGKIDFNEISSRHDWDRFCLVMAYSNPEEELASFINDASSIVKEFPYTYEDNFGVGILFVKNNEIIDSIRIPAINLPPSIDVGENIKLISKILDSGNIRIPPLNPTFTETDERPERTCYERDQYRIKINRDWEYRLLRRKGSND